MTLRLIALAVAALPLFAPFGDGRAQAQDRTLTGEITYLQRIALPPASTAIVEFRDAAGTLLAETRFGTGERQVPFPFEIAVPAETAGALRGGIVTGGQPAWATDPVEVAAGADALDLGTLRLHPVTPMGFASTFRCGETEVAIGFIGDIARMRLGGTTYDLAPEVTASGAKFTSAEDAGTFFWSRGESATVSVAGTALPECTIGLPVPVPPFRARGNEPGWTVSIAGGRIAFSLAYGERTVEAAQPAAELVDGATVYRLPDEALTLRIEDRLCQDTMTGMPYPASVTLETADGPLSGCGGEPADLLTGAEWVVEDVADLGIVDGANVTIAFLPEGRVAGSGGCNRYNAGFTLTGEGLAFGPAASTMMACAEALMNLEQRFHATLAAVDRFGFDETGALILMGPAGRIVARR
jgi:heat shock protein HslJ/uncharacterized lipoprotein YbaY